MTSSSALAEVSFLARQRCKAKVQVEDLRRTSGTFQPIDRLHRGSTMSLHGIPDERARKNLNLNKSQFILSSSIEHC